jgi:transcriptional regulator with XRE-family HTH domain
MSTNNKIKEVLTIKQLSPSQLADTIGVQRSSISHILSGRNKPSLDIIQRIVKYYTEFTYEWFLDEVGSHLPTASLDSYKQVRQSGSNVPEPTSTRRSTTKNMGIIIPESTTHQNMLPAQSSDAQTASTNQIDKILIFYTNGTFQEYKPS